jgi:hypothetical protein
VIGELAANQREKREYDLIRVRSRDSWLKIDLGILLVGWPGELLPVALFNAAQGSKQMVIRACPQLFRLAVQHLHQPANSLVKNQTFPQTCFVKMAYFAIEFYGSSALVSSIHSMYQVVIIAIVTGSGCTGMPPSMDLGQTYANPGWLG